MDCVLGIASERTIPLRPQAGPSASVDQRAALVVDGDDRAASTAAAEPGTAGAPGTGKVKKVVKKVVRRIVPKSEVAAKAAAAAAAAATATAEEGGAAVGPAPDTPAVPPAPASSGVTPSVDNNGLHHAADAAGGASNEGVEAGSKSVLLVLQGHEAGQASGPGAEATIAAACEPPAPAGPATSDASSPPAPSGLEVQGAVPAAAADDPPTLAVAHALEEGLQEAGGALEPSPDVPAQQDACAGGPEPSDVARPGAGTASDGRGAALEAEAAGGPSGPPAPPPAPDEAAAPSSPDQQPLVNGTAHRTPEPADDAANGGRAAAAQPHSSSSTGGSGGCEADVRGAQLLAREAQLLAQQEELAARVAELEASIRARDGKLVQQAGQLVQQSEQLSEMQQVRLVGGHTGVWCGRTCVCIRAHVVLCCVVFRHGYAARGSHRSPTRPRGGGLQGRH